MADGEGGMKQTLRPETQANCDELAGERRIKKNNSTCSNCGIAESYTDSPCPIGITGNQQGIGALRDLT